MIHDEIANRLANPEEAVRLDALKKVLLKRYMYNVGCTCIMITLYHSDSIAYPHIVCVHVHAHIHHVQCIQMYMYTTHKHTHYSFTICIL